MAKAKKQEVQTHPLDTLAADPLRALGLLLWKDRFKNTELSVQITEQDIHGMEDCINYLGLSLKVNIERGHGRPAFPGNPAKDLPAREAEPDMPWLTVSLLGIDSKGVVCAVRPVENNIEDHKLMQQAKRVAQAKEDGLFLGQRLLAAARSGEFSTSEMTDAARALLTLARA